MKTRGMNIAQKASKLRKIFGSRKAAIDYMGTASVSSLKRWEKREVKKPLRAHTRDVDEALRSAQNLEGVLMRRIERRLERERLERGYGKRKR